MPVRTDRGRVAVYRKVWGWPLRSPRHLAITAVVVLAVGTGAAIAGAAISGEDQGTSPAVASSSTRPPSTTNRSSTSSSATRSATTSSAPAITVTAAVPPITTSATTQPAALDPAAAAAAVAREFMVRWVNHPAGMTSKQWAAQLVPYVVAEYVVVLETVEPSNIPATRVTGDPIIASAVPAAAPTVIELDVATDGGAVHLVLLAQPDKTWRVRSYSMGTGT